MGPNLASSAQNDIAPSTPPVGVEAASAFARLARLLGRLAARQALSDRSAGMEPPKEQLPKASGRQP